MTQSANRGAGAMHGRLPDAEDLRRFEEILKAYGASEDEIESARDGFLTAVYYLCESPAAAAVYLRALRDLYAEYAANEDPDAQSGISLYNLLLTDFLGVCAGNRFLGDMQGFLTKNAAALCVFLPGAVLPLQLPSPHRLQMISDLTGDSDIKSLMCGTSAAVKEIMERSGAPVRRVDKSVLRSDFLENYDVYDAVGALDSVQVDIRELMKRFGKYIGKRTGLATAMDDGSDGVGFVSLGSRIIDFVDQGLVARGLGELTEAQGYRLLLYFMLRFRVYNSVVLCKNSEAGVTAQRDFMAHKGYESLKAEDLKEDAKRPLPLKTLLDLPHPAVAFTGTEADLLNDYVMRLDCSDHDGIRAFEQSVIKSLSRLADDRSVGVQVHFRQPQKTSELLVQERWILADLKDVNVDLEGYAGRVPAQGWRSVLVRIIEDVPRAEVIGSLMRSAERIKQIRDAAYLGGRHARGSAKVPDNVALGILPGENGLVSGSIKTFCAGECVNGSYVSMPEGRTLSHEVYLTSAEASLCGMIDCIEPFNVMDGRLLYFLVMQNDADLADRDNAMRVNEFRAYEYLKNTMHSQLRVLHSKQMNTTSLLQVRYIRDLLEQDLYYLFDGFVLLSMVFEQLMRTRKKKQS